MKKTLSIIIAIAMIAAMALPMGIFASAEEVVEVATWAEFVEKVEAAYGEGSYKLTADVTCDTTITSFTGTFDGNGHTVYVAATMFELVSAGATLKNFTTELADKTNEDGTKFEMTATPIAAEVADSFEDLPVTFENITNNVDVAWAESQRPSAGIIGRTNSDAYLILKNIVNNGDITSSNQTGGIIGNACNDSTSNKLYILAANVVNNGTIYANNPSGDCYGGGIIGNCNGCLYGVMTNIVNNGDVTAMNDVAGLVGNIKGASEFTVNYFVNTGDMFHNPVVDEATGAKLAGKNKDASKYGSAGVVARIDNAATIINLNNCVIGGALTADSATAEDGTVTSASADAFNGYRKDGAAVNLKNCCYLYGMLAVGGAITATAGEGFVSADQVTIDAAIATYAEACKDFDPGTFAAPSEAPAAPEVTLPSTPDTDAPVTDAPVTDAPVTDAPVTDAPVTDAPVTDAPVTDAPVTDAPVTDAPVTDAPADDTTAPSKPETGDNTFAIVLAVVAVAAIGCVAVSLRKREEN